MGIIDVRPKSECRWDEVSFGEIMLRLDPGDGRIHTQLQEFALAGPGGVGNGKGG